jgi:MFS family permease
MIPHVTHYKRIAVAGAGFSIVCLGLLSALAGTASLAMIELLVIGVGIGSGTGFPVSTVSVQNAVERAHLGVATGVLTFLRSLGGALGVALLGAVAMGYGLPLVEHGFNATAPVGSATPFVVIFAVSAVLMAGSLAMLSLMPEKPLRGTHDPAPTARG